jgi:heme/copper-type cytochrome/quinol oxidase subunit 2
MSLLGLLWGWLLEVEVGVAIVVVALVAVVVVVVVVVVVMVVVRLQQHYNDSRKNNAAYKSSSFPSSRLWRPLGR